MPASAKARIERKPIAAVCRRRDAFVAPSRRPRGDSHFRYGATRKIAANAFNNLKGHPR
jgi:hypothetical protein